MIADELATYDREVFGVLNLKSNGLPINFNICSVGTLDSALVSPREILKASVLSNAASCICFHVHPSGSPEPSAEDFLVTERLKQACDIIGIRMLDHQIIGAATREKYSFRESGYLDSLKPVDKELTR